VRGNSGARKIAHLSTLTQLPRARAQFNYCFIINILHIKIASAAAGKLPLISTNASHALMGVAHAHSLVDGGGELGKPGQLENPSCVACSTQHKETKKIKIN